MNTAVEIPLDTSGHGRVHVGERVQLEPVVSETPVRYECRVIGYMPEQSLIVTAPQSHGNLVLVRQDQQFNVRMMDGLNAQGFVTGVLAAPVKPYPHLHLAFPKEMERVIVRSAERVDCDLITAAQPLGAKQDAWIKTHMLDISVGGGRLRSTRPLAKIGGGLRLMFELPSLDGAEQLTLNGIVRNHAELKDGNGRRCFHSGVEFRNLNRIQRLFIHAFVVDQILRRRP